MAAIKPQPLTGGSYRQQLWDSIKTSEGEVLRIYSDSGGVPTIGAGYALIQKIKGIQTLRDPKDIAKDLGRTLNSAELTLLERQARLLNGQMNSADETYYRNTTYLATAVPSSSGQTIWQKAGLPPVGTRAQLTGKQRLDLAKAAIPVYQTGQNLQQKNRFSFALSAGEPRQIFDRVAKDVEAETLKQIRAVGRNHRFPQADIDRLTDGLLRRDASGNVVGGSREMIALFSLQYNIANKFPETIKAALGGDRARMYLEIVYRTNPNKAGKRSLGIAKRRLREGQFVLPGLWSGAQVGRFGRTLKANAGEIGRYETAPELAPLFTGRVSPLNAPAAQWAWSRPLASGTR